MDLYSFENWWKDSPVVSKIKGWCWHSLTVAWAYIKILFGSLLLLSHEIFDYLNTIITDDGVKAAIATMNFPAYVGLGLAVIGCVTLAARMRPHSNQPVVQTLGGSEPVV